MEQHIDLSNNDSDNNHFFHKIMPPILNSYCTQHPIQICYSQLLMLTEHHRPITHSQLAWLQAITEAKIQDINAIDWKNHNLLKRVQELQELFRKLLEEEISKYLGDGGYTEETACKNIGITRKDELHPLDKNRVEYWIPLNVINQLLNTISQRFRFEGIKKSEETRMKAKQAARNYNLSQINLTVELIRNLSNHFTNCPVTFDVQRLPELIWLKYLAHYLAISSRKYADYGDIDYDDSRLLNNALRIHKVLRDALNNNLNITLNSPSLMIPWHHKIATDAGVTDIAVVATKPERKILDELRPRLALCPNHLPRVMAQPKTYIRLLS